MSYTYQDYCNGTITREQWNQYAMTNTQVFFQQPEMMEVLKRMRNK